MKINVVIRQKKGLVWQGEADALSSTNEIGNFDILPEHAHFVGLVEKYIEVHIGEQVKRWEIERGILNVRDTIVEVYLGY